MFKESICFKFQNIREAGEHLPLAQKAHHTHNSLCQELGTMAVIITDAYETGGKSQCCTKHLVSTSTINHPNLHNTPMKKILLTPILQIRLTKKKKNQTSRKSESMQAELARWLSS